MSNPSALPIDLTPEEARAAADVVAMLRRRRTREEECMHLVNHAPDAEIIRAAEAECEAGTPITLADRYDGGGYVLRGQELWFSYVGAHARRPVIMRGARWSRVSRWGKSGNLAANGWAEYVLERAIRRARLTALTDDELQTAIAPILAKLRNRYRLTGHFTQPRIYSQDWGWVFIGGKRSSLNPSELANVTALRSIIAKTDKLDERLASAREHAAQRMAA